MCKWTSFSLFKQKKEYVSREEILINSVMIWNIPTHVFGTGYIIPISQVFSLLLSPAFFKLNCLWFFQNWSLTMSEEDSIPQVVIAKPKHPKYTEMVEEAVKYFNEKGGSSRQAITKYIKGKYLVGETANNQIKLALVKSVGKGRLVQTKGAGASGSFKLSKEVKEEEKREEKRRLKKEKKALKEKENAERDIDNNNKKKASKVKKTSKKQPKDVDGEDKENEEKGRPKKKSSNKTKESTSKKKREGSKDTALEKKSKPKAKKSTVAESSEGIKKAKKTKKPAAKPSASKISSTGKKTSEKGKDKTKVLKSKNTTKAKPKSKKQIGKED